MGLLIIDLEEATKYAKQRLGEMKDGNVDIVLQRSLKRAAEAYRTATIRETKKKYILKDEAIDANIRIFTLSRGFNVKTTSWSKLVTHYEYASVTKKGGRKNSFNIGERQHFATRVFKKNKLKYLSTAFWAKSKVHEGGVLLQRPRGLTGKAAHPKKKEKNWLVLGPAVGVIVQNKKTVDVAKKRANEILEKRIDHEVDRILSRMAQKT